VSHLGRHADDLEQADGQCRLHGAAVLGAGVRGEQEGGQSTDSGEVCHHGATITQARRRARLSLSIGDILIFLALALPDRRAGPLTRRTS